MTIKAFYYLLRNAARGIEYVPVITRGKRGARYRNGPDDRIYTKSPRELRMT